MHKVQGSVQKGFVALEFLFFRARAGVCVCVCACAHVNYESLCDTFCFVFVISCARACFRVYLCVQRKASAFYLSFSKMPSSRNRPLYYHPHISCLLFSSLHGEECYVDVLRLVLFTTAR